MRIHLTLVGRCHHVDGDSIPTRQVMHTEMIGDTISRAYCDVAVLTKSERDWAVRILLWRLKMSHVLIVESRCNKAMGQLVVILELKLDRSAI